IPAIQSEAIAKDKHRVRVAMILAEKIRFFATNPVEVDCRAPVLAECLRIFRAKPGAGEILTDSGFERHTTIGIDGVVSAAQKGVGDSAIWSEGFQLATLGDDLPGIASDKTPFSGLPLELQDILRVIIHSRIRRREIRRLRLKREPTERHGGISADHAQF